MSPEERADEVMSLRFGRDRRWWPGGLVAVIAHAVRLAEHAATAAERERCEKIAETEGPCCYYQGCHETVAARIREGGVS